MRKSIPFRDVQRLLESHGYLLVEVRGSHRVFQHADPKKPAIVLPLYQGRDVSELHVRAMRRVLDESAVIPATQFNRALKLAG